VPGLVGAYWYVRCDRPIWCECIGELLNSEEERRYKKEDRNPMAEECRSYKKQSNQIILLSAALSRWTAITQIGLVTTIIETII